MLIGKVSGFGYLSNLIVAIFMVSESQSSYLIFPEKKFRQLTIIFSYGNFSILKHKMKSFKPICKK